MLSAGPRRSTIEFVTPDRVTYRPELGVLYPSELDDGHADLRRVRQEQPRPGAGAGPQRVAGDHPGGLDRGGRLAGRRGSAIRTASSSAASPKPTFRRKERVEPPFRRSRRPTPGRPTCTCFSRGRSVSCLARAACLATTSSSTWGMAPTPHSPTSNAARCKSGRARSSARASSWPNAGTLETRASHTSTSS